MTCTESNTVIKAGTEHLANDRGLIIVRPDIYPRDVNIEEEDELTFVPVLASTFTKPNNVQLSYVIKYLVKIIIAYRPVRGC